MPDKPNPRLVQEAAAELGMSVEDYRDTSEYAASVEDGSIVDPPKTGPNVDAGLVPGDVTVDPGVAAAPPAEVEPEKKKPDKK